VIAGYIDELQSFFERVGIGKQLAINVPPDLNTFECLQREVKVMTMKEFRECDLMPVFVKPGRYPKECLAGAITKESSKSFLSDVHDDVPVMVSNVVNMVSEYRCYIIRGKLHGIKHYQGDIRKFPDVEMIDKMISMYKNAPDGYSLDVAVLDNGKTVLVEVQDGWALGNYGLEPDIYARLLLVRWTQLMNTKTRSTI
jgi:hypothetical protein